MCVYVFVGGLFLITSFPEIFKWKISNIVALSSNLELIRKLELMNYFPT